LGKVPRASSLGRAEARDDFVEAGSIGMNAGLLNLDAQNQVT
jgi:hypothetical protein